MILKMKYTTTTTTTTTFKVISHQRSLGLSMGWRTPFNNKTSSDHSYTELVRYSDPLWSQFTE